MLKQISETEEIKTQVKENIMSVGIVKKVGDKYALTNEQGKEIVKGKLAYIYHLYETESQVLSKAGITEIVMAEAGNTVHATPAAPTFTVAERFDFLGSLLKMVIDKQVNSLILAGRGGIGKTHSVLTALAKAGKTNVNTCSARLVADVETGDDDDEVETKVNARINSSAGDYVVIKGHMSAAALYREMYFNSNKIFVFDDCDSILKDETAVNLLKAALDTYETRVISWYKAGNGESDLPSSFVFHGQVIIISNKDLDDINEAVLTRAFNIDLGMSKAERIERMRMVLADVMDHIDMDIKEDAINFMDENKELTNNINFRALMQIITIRNSAGPNWKRLAMYTMMNDR